MSEGSEANTATMPNPVGEQKAIANPACESKALEIIDKTGGIKTSRDFKNVMAALMEDLMRQSVEPRIGNAVCNAGGKLLKIIELEIKYGRLGTADGPPPEKTILLTS
jgi:hypothetical protein